MQSIIADILINYIISIIGIIGIGWMPPSLHAQIIWQKATLPASETLRTVIMNDSIALGLGKISVFRSSNYGKTWQAVSDSILPIKKQYSDGFLAVSIHSGRYRNSSIFFVFDSLAYRSSNAGLTWEVIHSLPPNTSFFAAAGEIFFALTPTGILYNSNDGGRQWEKTQTSGLSGFGNIISISSNRKSLFILYLYEPYRASSNTILRSLDTGRTWERLQWVNPGVNSGIYVQGDTLWAGLLSNNRDTVYRSTDNGTTWQSMSKGLQTTLISSLVVHNNKVFIGTREGGFVFNAVNNMWLPISSSSVKTAISFLQSGNSSVLFGTVGTPQMVRSEDEGKNWTSASQGLFPRTLFPITVTATGMFAQESSLVAPERDYPIYIGAVIFSKDKGQSWQTTNTGIIGRSGIIQTKTSLWSSPFGVFLSKSNFNVSPLNFITVENLGAVDIIAGNQSVLFLKRPFGVLTESRDEGVTFQPNSLTTYSYTSHLPPPVLEELFLQDSTVYATTDKGVYVSHDIGRTWTQTASLQTFQNRTVRPTVLINGNAVFATVNPQRVLVITNATSTLGNGYVLSPDFYRSLDSGKIWERMNLPDVLGVHAIVNIGTTIFAASLKNLYQSTNLGETWQRISQGLPDGKITTLANDATTLFVCIGNQGLYRTEVRPVKVYEAGNSMYHPLASPNPATDFTDISFTLPRPASTQISLSSTLGTEVWQSGSGVLPAGEQRLRIDTRGLPAGIYFLRCSIGGQVVVRQVAVMR
jgi:photosystem II stability/assembly factor-like uncharacterized protein